MKGMKRLILVAALYCLALARGVNAWTKRYENVRVYHVARDEHVIQHLLESDAADVWAADETGFHVMMSAEEAHALKVRFPHVPFTTVLNEGEVQESIDKEQRRLQSRSLSKADWFEDYHDYNETYAWYQDLANQYSDLVEFVPSIGKTWNGLDLFAVHVTAPNATAQAKKQIWIQSNIHAREWITSATLQFFYNQLLTRYGVDQEVTGLLNDLEFILIPYVNPDGFAYTWTDDRLWRKNRRNNGNGSYGVDLNRNWDDHWSETGSSSNPASDTYHGPSSASEPEVQALSAYFLAHPNIVGAIDLHSYGQLILRPYAWTRSKPPSESVVGSIGDKIKVAIVDVHGKRYTSDNWYTGLYASSGVSMDWFHGDKVGAAFGFRPIAFTIELRPTTAYPGFQLPPDQIIPTGEEITAALIYFAGAARDNTIAYP